MPTPHKIGPIARKLLKHFQNSYQQKVVNLQAWRQSQSEFDTISIDITSRLTGNPKMVSFDLYNFVQNWAMGIMEVMQEMPELDKLMTRIEAAQEEYMPGYPPMSPITGTFFWTWVLYDLTHNAQGETFAAILLALGQEFKMSPVFMATLAILSQARLGLHVCEGQQDGRVLLTELVTGTSRICDTGSGYKGVRGELWLARVLPPPMPEVAYSLVLTTPYVVLDADRTTWGAYLQRTLPKINQNDQQAAYAGLMKGALAPNYWLEYVFEAYSNYNDHAIFIVGLPDIDKSRPHSRANY